MFKNHLKIALRNLIRSKFSSTIKIGGFSAGMTVAMLIGLWISDELSFNKCFKNYDRIALVMRHETWEGVRNTLKNNTIPMGTELRSAYAEDFKYVVMSTQTADHIISSGDKNFMQAGNVMQPEAPEMFNLRMLSGSRMGLTELNSILLNQSLAKRLFGDADPINKMVTIDTKLIVKVTGVYEDLPDNCEFKNVSFIAPWDLFVTSDNWYKNHQNDWTDNFLYIYTLLSPHADVNKISSKIKEIKLTHTNKEEAKGEPAMFLQPMSKWHLHSQFRNGKTIVSEQLHYVRVYSIIGIFVLFLACINFINLSTVQSEKKAKEVGVRKAAGSLKSQLRGQFFSEALLVVMAAYIISIALIRFILPWFNQFSDKNLVIPWTNPYFWLTGVIFAIITGIIAGIYPALYLSSFDPVKVLKGTYRIGSYASIPRKILVVVQFVVSIALINCSIIVYRQIQYSKSRPVGYGREGLIYINMQTDDIHKYFNAFRDDLLKTNSIKEIAESNGSVTELWSANGGFNWPGKDPDVKVETDFGTIGVSQAFGKTVGWQVIDGRDFQDEFKSDLNGMIVNESAKKYMGLRNPVGEYIQWGGKNYMIIGVIKDMVMESPYKPVTPTVFFLGSWDHATVNIKINPVMSASESLAKIESVYKKYSPGTPFDYRFADEEYSNKFSAEVRIGKMVGFFVALAILISCSGLFGLALFITEQRTKEIVIRKVMGASALNLWILLSKDFIALIITSFIIATPLAAYIMYNWLQNYQYRTKISWLIFAAAGIGAIIITLFTISFYTLKAITTNPAKSLGNE